jgi:outer membrane protein assembly factor BamB
MFRGPNGSGVGTAVDLPLHWDPQTGENILWSLPDEGLGLSSPVVWGDRVFLTTAADTTTGTERKPIRLTREELAGGTSMRPIEDATPKDWIVLCLNRSNGSTVWRRVLRSGTPKSKRHAYNSFATPTPALDGEHIVVSFGSEGLYCLDIEGRVLWQKDIGPLDIGSYEDHSWQWGYASSPVIYGRSVYVQADIDKHGFVAAFDIETGREIWRTERAETESWSTPAIQSAWNPPQIVLIAPFHVSGYDLRTGGRIWKLYWGMDITEPTPVVTPDLVFVASGKGPQAPIVAVEASARGDITPERGAKHDPGIRWRSEKGGPITTTPLVYRGLLYTVSDFGIVRCLDAARGTVKYEARVPGAAFQSSPVAAEGKLYLTSVEGDVYVIPAGPPFTIAARNSFGETCQTTPAISGDRLIFRTRRAVYCVGRPRRSESR